MQGVNKIYFKRNINFKDDASGDEAIESARYEYVNSIKDAIETACPGWFDNIEYEFDGSGSYNRYRLNFIIDNIILLRIQLTASSRYEVMSIATWYDSGNSSYVPFTLGSDTYGDGRGETTWVSAIIYSKNFCAIETSNHNGGLQSSVLIFCKSNLNNTVVIMPSTMLADNNVYHNNILTAYPKKAINENRTRPKFSAHTVYSGFRLPGEDSDNTPSSYGDINNKYYDNYMISRSLLDNNDNNKYIENIQSRGFINNRFIFTPLYITGRTDEYCPGVYYMQNNPVILSPSCNTILEIGKDFYFTNGVVAIKLT